MPDLTTKMELRDVESLLPYARNARRHPVKQIDLIVASIAEFGFNVPVLIDGAGVLIAGPGRVLAARKMGMKQVPTIVIDHLSEAQVTAFRIADNRLAEQAGWDKSLLTLEFQALDDLKFDLSLTGFDAATVVRMMGYRGGADPDAEAVLPVSTAVQDGDIWRLGAHRLACGDCTSAPVVAALLGGVRPHLMVTDPPYGVEYDANWRNEAFRSDGSPIAGRAIGKVQNDGISDWRRAWAHFPGDVAYVWHAGLHARSVVESLEASGFALRAQIIWAKSNMAIGRGDYHYQHEPCWYAVRKGANGHWAGDRSQTTLWEIDKPQKSETGHSTQKPVECMRRPIENNSQPGDAVFEPFSGSGTTIIAAEMTGRVCYACEIHPPYVEMAIRRWETFTCQTATLERTGESLADLMPAAA